MAPPPAAGQPPGRPPIERLKWTADDFAAAGDGQLPMGEPKEQWAYGDLDGGFAAAALVLDETFVVNATGHHPMETRSAMAYWRGDTLYLHCSTQSVIRTVEPVARWVGIDPSKVVLICEYTGGGFGSKGAGAVSMAIPALLSKKVGAPVMMRVSREEESYFGRARTNMTGRAKIGFATDGRIEAMDLFVVQDNGPYGPMGDWRSGANAASLVYQPKAMRVRVANVFTNTPPRTQQRSPGPMQFNGIVEGVLTKAAKQLGIDQVAMRRVNAPEGKARYGPLTADGSRRYVTGAFVKDALDRGAELFDWSGRLARSGQRQGTKARGIGVAVGPHGAGSIGFDGLMLLTPEGRLQVHSGVGNLGTHSVIDLARVAADVIAIPWDKVDVVWGDVSKGLPWSCMSVGSQTTHAMTRANLAGAEHLKRQLQSLAAQELGGRPEDYALSGERVHRAGNPGGGLTLRAGGNPGHRAGRAFRRPRGARRHPPDDQDGGREARRTGPDGRGQGHVSARRRHLRLRRWLRRGGSGRRNRRRVAHRLPVGGRRRHGGEPPQPDRAAERRLLSGHRPRVVPETGLRPALRRVAGAALPPQQAADHPGHSADEGGGARASPTPRRRPAPRAWASRRSAPATARC